MITHYVLTVPPILLTTLALSIRLKRSHSKRVKKLKCNWEKTNKKKEQSDWAHIFLKN